MKIIKFLVLFTTGFCIYITIEVCFRGYSYPLMGVCGGLALILNDKINDKISWNMDILLQGIFGSITITLFELVIGMMAKAGFVQIMWDYSNVTLNFAGVICVQFSLLWALLSIVGVFISDAINYYLFEEEPLPYYKLFGRKIIQFKERGCVKHDTNN